MFRQAAPADDDRLAGRTGWSEAALLVIPPNVSGQ